MKLGIMTAVVAVLLVGLAAPTATARGHRDRFTYTWSGTARTIVVDADRVGRGWRLRRAVRAWNRVPGVRLRMGECSQARQRWHCARVTDRNRGPREWWGRTRWPRRGNDRARVWLNTYYGRDATVTCHELGHVLGLKHHGRPHGCVSEPGRPRVAPTRWERRFVGRQWRQERRQERRRQDRGYRSATIVSEG